MGVDPGRLRLPLGSPELPAILESGTMIVDGQAVAVVPTSVDETSVQLVPVDPAADRPPAPSLWWRAVRPISLTATATPALAMIVYGVRHQWAIDWRIAIPALLGALLLQVAVNLLNDVEDHLRLIDLPGGPGGAGVIQRGWLTARRVRRAAFGALALGVLCGAPALFRAPLPILAIGALGVLGTLGYSGRPFGWKYRALGDLAVLALCGPGMTLGMSWAAFGRGGLAPWLLGGYFGLLAVAILHANNLEDRELDRRRGAVTVAQQLGARGGRAYFVLLYLVAFALPPLAWWAGAIGPIAAFLPLVGLPVIALPPNRLRAAQAHLALGVLFLLALLAS